MKGADIEIGTEYALYRAGTLRKIRVTAKNLRIDSWSKQANGVRFEVVTGPPVHAAGHVAKTRDIDPWTSYHDAKLQADEKEKERQLRIERVSQRLGVSVLSSYGRRVALLEDDFYTLAERLGVETD